MESPVMTSASSHRLRSAVSACAQPTHSYLNSSYLNTSIQVESHNSGGCFKKFNTSGKNGDTSLLNITRKPLPSTDFSSLRKKHKISNKHSLHHQRAKRNGNEVENSSNDVLNLIPNQLMLGNDFLSKLKFNGKLLESKRLADYLEKAPRNESGISNCEKVINGKSGHKNKKNTSNGYCNNNNNKVLNHRHNNCNKGKSKKNTNTGKKDSINEESERGYECSKCVVHVDEGIGDARQEISKWQPKHVVTRRTAQILRDIRNAWQSRVGLSNSVPSEKIKLLFNDLQLFSPDSEVWNGSHNLSSGLGFFCKMLEITKETRVTLEDLYRFADRSYKDERPSPIPRILDKHDEKRGRKKGMSKYEVFLGGSCNPTTWRTDFAIPELEKMGISYYNPRSLKPRRDYNAFQLFQQQVEEWRPELMEVEYHAKENATVMFFVLDNQTRGVSALIEVAHLAGNRRKLILVIQSYTQKNQIICDEEISKKEYEDLKKGQEVLQVLVERQGIPVFRSIQVALQYTEKILKENLRVQDLQLPVHVNRENLICPRDVFEKLDSRNSGEISAGDARLALKILNGVEVSDAELKNVISKTGKELNGTLLGNIKFDFEHFSELVTQFKRKAEGIPWDSPSLSCACYKDVYLGGTIENTSWRESIAIPALEEESLSYFLPKASEGGDGFTEIEAAAIDNSLVLLFVITNTARSIAAMAIAGHYIGKGANVVLCVEHFPENATVGTEKLSESAVKDYNRGRMYLTDIAERSDVPVFYDISTAVKFVIQKRRRR